MKKNRMEYSVVASFSGVMPEHDPNYYPCDVTLNDALRACEKIFDVSEQDLSELGESEYDYLSEDPNDWYSKLQDLQVSGILTRAELETWFDNLGAFAEDVQTLGTLGGPANWCGLAPDISCRIESQVLIECIRITPMPLQKTGLSWDYVRDRFIATFGA